jgi:hypothetical protein
MSYYLRLSPDGVAMGLWRIEHDTAVRIDVTLSEISQFKANPGETIWESMQRQVPAWFVPDGENPFHKTVLGPGEYYPRMARPLYKNTYDPIGWSPSSQTEAGVLAVAHSQTTVLTRQLERICQTVHPTEETFSTFGHDIRNLLILACTEAESHWRGVLVANGITNDRFNRKDYFALLSAMRLDEYAISFSNYPWLTTLSPYKGWPTQGLPWYDAYNAVKHDRETSFKRATLFHAFEAVSACVIMLAAQFGLHNGLHRGSDLWSFFHFPTVPVWSPSEFYISRYDVTGGSVQNLWSPVSFPFKEGGTKRP